METTSAVRLLARKAQRQRSETEKTKSIRFRTSFSNTVYDVLSGRLGWRETDHPTEWDFLWVERDEAYEVFDSIHLRSNQMINHFRNDRELCRKDLLLKNLKRRRRLLSKQGCQDNHFSFWPTSFVLPSEYSMFVEEFKRSGGTWIMKPISKSQGKGIFLFDALEQIDPWRNDMPGRSTEDAEAYIVQRYISHPLLVGGKKFDMRLYALVTSWSPLVVWLYRAGFCRFSSEAYCSTQLDNIHAHLTNVAVQKKSSSYDPQSGGKWEIRQLKLFLISRYGTSIVSTAFAGVQRIIVQSLEAVQPVIIQDRHCFELYGYDIIFDAELRPWLLEVNGAPSLTASTAEDRRMKCEMLSSVLDVIDMEKRRTGGETQIGGFDLVYNGEPASRNADEPSGSRHLPKLSRRGAGGETKFQSPRRIIHKRSHHGKNVRSQKKGLICHTAEHVSSRSPRDTRSSSGTNNNCDGTLLSQSLLGAMIPCSSLSTNKSKSSRLV